MPLDLEALETFIPQTLEPLDSKTSNPLKAMDNMGETLYPLKP
jgi:hypothetical protein